MISVRDLIRVLRFPLQEFSDWISLARPSQLDYGAVAEVSLYVAGVPARPPTPLFTRVRGREILRSSAGIELSEIGLSKEEEEFDVRAYQCRGSHRGVRD